MRVLEHFSQLLSKLKMNTCTSISISLGMLLGGKFKTSNVVGHIMVLRSSHEVREQEQGISAWCMVRRFRPPFKAWTFRSVTVFRVPYLQGPPTRPVVPFLSRSLHRFINGWHFS